jgi:hypothetical protein
VLRLVPIGGLRVLGVVDLLLVVPVLGLLRLGILDLLGRQEVPVLVQGAGLCLLVVDQNLVGAVSVDDEGVEVGEDVVLAADLLLDQVVLALVAEDDVYALRARAADVGALNKHLLATKFLIDVQNINYYRT